MRARCGTFLMFLEILEIWLYDEALSKLMQTKFIGNIVAVHAHCLHTACIFGDRTRQETHPKPPTTSAQ